MGLGHRPNIRSSMGVLPVNIRRPMSGICVPFFLEIFNHRYYFFNKEKNNNSLNANVFVYLAELA